MHNPQRSLFDAKKAATYVAAFEFEDVRTLVLQGTAFQCRVVDTEGTHLTKFLLHVGDDTHTGVLVHLQGGGQQRAVGLVA